MQYIGISEVAKDLNLSDRSVQRYCKEGFLPAKRIYANGKYIYLIDRFDYYEWKGVHFKGIKAPKLRKDLRVTRELTKEDTLKHIEIWLDWCATGKLNGKPIAPRTIELYRYYFGLYLECLGKKPRRPIISLDNLRKALGEISLERHSTRLNIYSAVQSYSKYLIEIDKLEVEFTEQLKKLRPKRLLPAKKTYLNEDDFLDLLNKVSKLKLKEYDSLLIKTLLIFLVNTGLRNAELCKLKLNDLDLNQAKVFVKLGKGNKNRVVGLNKETCLFLQEYLKARLKLFPDLESKDNVFLNSKGNPFNIESLAHKINKVSKRVGYDISPHSLRRSFVTINVNKGRQLVFLQIACGHADINTTRDYCQTNEDEVVKAMRDW